VGAVAAVCAAVSARAPGHSGYRTATSSAFETSLFPFRPPSLNIREKVAHEGLKSHGLDECPPFVAVIALTQCLIDIRRALGDDSQRMIRTVPRRGYLFDVPVTINEAEGEPRSPGAGSARSSEAERSSDARRVGPLSLFGGHNRYAAIAIALTVSVGLLAAYITGPAEPVRIAVLPFGSLSSDPEQVYFSDGLASESSFSVSAAQGSALRRRRRRSCFATRARASRRSPQHLALLMFLKGAWHEIGTDCESACS
jgi:adenylate cyclase